MGNNKLVSLLIGLTAFVCFHAEISECAAAAELLTAGEQAQKIDFRAAGFNYEILVQNQKQALGYRVLKTKSPNNMGVDRIATRNGKVEFIQAKAWKSVRGGTVSGALDALEFYGGNLGKRLPFLQDNDRRYLVSMPKDKYAKSIEKGWVNKNGAPSQELIRLTKSEATEFVRTKPTSLKSVRYRAVSGSEQRILTKVHFEPGPVAYDEIQIKSIGLGSEVKNASLASEETTLIGFETAQKWLGRAGVVALIGTESYIIYGATTGRMSNREFVTAQSAIVGGGLGAWGGASAGATIGAGIGVWFGGAGAAPGAAIGGLIGGIAGGFGGAALGEVAATGYYGRLDQRQKEQVETFIYQHYGVRQ